VSQTYSAVAVLRRTGLQIPESIGKYITPFDKQFDSRITSTLHGQIHLEMRIGRTQAVVGRCFQSNASAMLFFQYETDNAQRSDNTISPPDAVALLFPVEDLTGALVSLDRFWCLHHRSAIHHRRLTSSHLMSL
jgi:hypothetical protein